MLNPAIIAELAALGLVTGLLAGLLGIGGGMLMVPFVTLILSAREVADMFPLARTDDLLAGFYVPGDGRVNPVDVTMALGKGARVVVKINALEPALEKLSDEARALSRGRAMSCGANIPTVWCVLQRDGGSRTAFTRSLASTATRRL